MDASPSPSALVKLLLPKTPFIFKTALWHTLSMSPTSSKWDLRTEVTVNTLRQMLGPTTTPTTITQQQRMTTKDAGVKGKVWVSKVKIDVPEEDDLRHVLFKAVDDLRGDLNGERDGNKELYTKPNAVPLEAEWTGYRADATDTEPEPAGLSETDKYAKLLVETSSKVTILYFHGGAMYLADPSTYRPTVAKLAKATGGRVFNLRYRLAPQNPFPAALLDALTAYLTLLYPPLGAPHDPIPASEIVFSGDSAGGMLCASLLQLLLQMHRSNPTTPASLPKVRFHGKEVEIPFPAGVALTSPWLDVTRSLPSIEALAHYDYLPLPFTTHTRRPPPCEAWPAKPPRADMYCNGPAMRHPLVSPVVAPSWHSSPPIFFSLGQEMHRDEAAVLAQRLHSQNVPVVWREFEAMPHVFPMMLDWTPQASHHLEETARFCKSVVESGIVEASGEFILAKTMKREVVDLSKLTDLTDEQVEMAMKQGQKKLEAKGGYESLEARSML